MPITTKKHNEIFNHIYENNIWGGGSGGGSNPENVVGWMQKLSEFIKDNNIKSIIDFGCGDWQFSHLLKYDKMDIQYLGIECVESLVITNTKNYSKDNIKFKYVPNYEDLNDEADLLIVKDVLMHWKNKDIIKFLDAQISKHKHILISNIITDKDRVDSDEPSIRPEGLNSLYMPLSNYKKEYSYIDNTNPLDLKEIVYFKRND